MEKIQHWILIALLFLYACSAEKKLYHSSTELNTIEGYENYLLKYENGKYAGEAKQKIKDISFSQCRDSAFSSFIKILKIKTSPTNAKIYIQPSSQVIMGTPVNIKLQHLPPEKVVTLHAYRRRWNGLIYAFASYQSNQNGQILLKNTESIYGTYSGADSLGIFWSMTWPFQNDLELPFIIDELKYNTVYFHIEMDKQIIASDSLILFDKLSHIITKKVDTDSLVGTLHYPRNGKHLPAIIIVGGGSQGEYDWSNQMAQIIASHGYATLALAYNNVIPLPKYLEKIPLEYFFHAVDWIKQQPMVDTEKIIMAGGSRGGELALLLASMDSDITGVIAMGPSSVIWQGLPHNPFNLICPKPAWTLNRKKLPYLKYRFHLPTHWKFISGEKQIEMMILHERPLENKAKDELALIRVEKINGPILFIAGKEDCVWPSYNMCQMMEHRLDSLQFSHPVQGLYYDDAGHKVIAFDQLPTIDYKYEGTKFGGTDSKNASAQIDSWNKMISFLHTYFPVE